MMEGCPDTPDKHWKGASSQVKILPPQRKLLASLLIIAVTTLKTENEKQY